MSLLRVGTEESNCVSWVQVAMSARTSGKWKSVHIKQQYNVAQAVSSIDDCANGEKFCLCEAVRVLIAASCGSDMVSMMLSGGKGSCGTGGCLIPRSRVYTVVVRSCPQRSNFV